MDVLEHEDCDSVHEAWADNEGEDREGREEGEDREDHGYIDRRDEQEAGV